jgi:hypothetical protein
MLVGTSSVTPPGAGTAAVDGSDNGMEEWERVAFGPDTPTETPAAPASPPSPPAATPVSPAGDSGPASSGPAAAETPPAETETEQQKQERLLAGKYKTPEELERGYESLNEAFRQKQSELDRLRNAQQQQQQQAPAPPPPPAPDETPAAAIPSSGENPFAGKKSERGFALDAYGIEIIADEDWLAYEESLFQHNLNDPRFQDEDGTPNERRAQRAAELRIERERGEFLADAQQKRESYTRQQQQQISQTFSQAREKQKTEIDGLLSSMPENLAKLAPTADARALAEHFIRAGGAAVAIAVERGDLTALQAVEEGVATRATASAIAAAIIDGSFWQQAAGIAAGTPGAAGQVPSAPPNAGGSAGAAQVPPSAPKTQRQTPAGVDDEDKAIAELLGIEPVPLG